MTREVPESAKYQEIVFLPDRLEGKLEPEGKSQIKLDEGFAIHGKQHEITAAVEAQLEDTMRPRASRLPTSSRE